MSRFLRGHAGLFPAGLMAAGLLGLAACSALPPQSTVAGRGLAPVAFAKAPAFDSPPRRSDPEPGWVHAILRESAGVRVEPAGDSVFESALPGAAADLEAAARRHGVLSASDLSGGRPGPALDSAADAARRQWGPTVPDLRSLVVLRFPPGTDTAKVAAELSALPSVAVAYPAPRLVQTGAQVSRTSEVSGGGTAPSDPHFDHEEGTWYWFRQHHVFEALDMVTPGRKMPIVAMIDYGFVPGLPDSPTYLPTIAFDHAGKAFPAGPGSGDRSLDVHGTMTAAILGAPRGNGEGLAGVLPGAPILPLRISGSVASLAAAILHATESEARVSSISLGFADGSPLSTDPILRAAMAYASSTGHLCVIPAGDNRCDLETWPSDDGGALIVGGSQRDGRNWADGPGSGSCHGTDIHLVAAASEVGAHYRDPETGAARWGLMNGNSAAVPMVAATAAIARDLYKAARPGPGTLEDVGILRNVLWGAASVGPSSDGHQYGHRLGDDPRNPGGLAKVRILHMANALKIAARPEAEPVVRIFNTSQFTWVGKGVATGGDTVFAQASAGDDVLWDLTDERLTADDTIDFGAYSPRGRYTHGYQIWRRGVLTDECLRGLSERRVTWASGPLYPAVEIDGLREHDSLHAFISFPAIR